MDWEQIPVRKLDGIGPQTALALEKLGIGRLGDLLRYYPADYERYGAPVPVREAVPGQVCVIRASIDTAPSTYGFGKNAILSFRVRDRSGTLRVSYFHAPYLKSSIHKYDERVFRGRVRDGGKYGLSMDQPEMFAPADYEALQGSIRPVYSLPAGLSRKRFRSAMEQALRYADHWPEVLPPEQV